MEKIRIGICGYGNLGKGVELAIGQNTDMELIGVFTRREPSSIKTNLKETKVYAMEEMEKMQNKIDVMILCGGSATDLIVQGPIAAKWFHTVDSYDTHDCIPEYFDKMNEVAMKSKKVSIVSLGWDPGLFSMNRILFDAILPQGKTYVFYGRGISQGHSDAIRRIEGVKDARQYTVPYEEAVQKVRDGKMPEFKSAREKMWRECFVVAEEGADKEKIEKEIKQMPHYFEEYNTVVHFISEEELKEKHAKLQHGGFVLRSAKTGMEEENNEIAEFSLKLDSNPQFTASVLVAYARAAYRIAQKEDWGAKTVADICPAMISPKSAEEIRKEML